RLAVAPDLQGQGIGMKLIMAVLQFLPEQTEEVWAFTGQDSKQSLSLYAKQGFEHEYDQNAGDLTYAYMRKILSSMEQQDEEQDVDTAGGRTARAQRDHSGPGRRLWEPVPRARCNAAQRGDGGAAQERGRSPSRLE